jgi:hypothetical protein
MNMSKGPFGKAINPREIHYENFQEGIEKFYFTIVEIIENSLGYKINKTEDSFLTSPGSAQWQVFEQRKAAQQEKAAQYLGSIGGMIKSMMTLYRELKILDERLGFYKEADKGSESAELSLKSLWIDLVEGGGKNPTSVLGLANQVGFVTLPDLFFRIDPKNIAEVDKQVDKIETNTQVKKVLKRKLHQYVQWRERTLKELTTRRYFNIKYLSQHFNVIKMYLEWVKPYLKNIKNLTQDGKSDKSYQLLQTSESLISDTEIICKGEKIDAATDYEHIFPVIIVKFHYRTRPVMAYQGQDYSKGAIQLGKIECKIEGYNVTKKEYDNYLENKDLSTMKLLQAVDESMAAFLNDDNSKKDFEAYLAEARNEEIKEKNPKSKSSLLDIFNPFSGRKNKKLKSDKKEDFSSFVNDYREEDSKNNKNGISKSNFSKVRKKHKLSIKNAERISKKYEQDKIKSKAAVEKDVDTLYDIIKINYGMIRNE